MPEVCVNRCRSSTGLSDFSNRLSLNSGNHLAAGSSGESFPSSARIMMPMAVIGLVIEAMRKSVSLVIGALDSEIAIADSRHELDARTVARHRDRAGDLALVDERLQRRLEFGQLGDVPLGRLKRRGDESEQQRQEVVSFHGCVSPEDWNGRGKERFVAMITRRAV